MTSRHIKPFTFMILGLLILAGASYACSGQQSVLSPVPADTAAELPSATTVPVQSPDSRQNVTTPTPFARLVRPLPDPGGVGLTFIHEVQGDVSAPDPDVPTPYPSAGDETDDSPILGATVTVEGVVTGWNDRAGQSNSGGIFHTDRGIYIQEEPEDQDENPVTSEGVFVQFSKAADSVEDFPIGSVLRVTGKVLEHFELTVIAPSEMRTVGTAPLPPPIVIDATKASREYYESLEGMRVTLEKGAATAGGTNRHGELFLRPGDSRELSVRGRDNTGILAVADDAGAGNPEIPRRRERPSSTFLAADLLDTVEGVTGVMFYSFDNYQIMLQSGIDGSSFPKITPYDANSYPYSQIAPVPDGRLRIAALNAENLLRVGVFHDGGKVDEAEHNDKVQRVAGAVELLQRPAIVAIQEVADVASLRRVAEALGGYSAFLEEGNDNRDIDVGFLVADYVNVVGVLQYGKNAPDTTVFSCGDINGILFDRPPLSVEVEYNGARLTVVSVHFSSRAAPDECREAQSEFVAEVTNSLKAQGKDVVIAGDLNAYEDEETLRILEDEAGLENMWFRAPEGEAYSSEFSGVLQTLDHILVSEGLASKVEDFRYAHISTHYYDRIDAGLKGQESAFVAGGHSQSDHDPALLTLKIED